MYCRLCKQLAFACRSWERKRAVSISEWDAMSILDYNPFSILSLSPPPPPPPSILPAFLQLSLKSS